MRRTLAVVAVMAAAALALTGCISTTPPPSTNSGTIKDGPKVLRILAGSEVADMLPILKTAEQQIGVDVELSYIGTIDGTTDVASGETKGKFDATWFPNNRYLSLLPGASSAISTSVKIMSSPVVFGLRPSIAHTLGWDTKAPTWAQLAEAASAGKFTYGMTNPAASNSGFSALVSVATALSGTGSALTTQNITSVEPQLASFFSGQKLTAGSSGFLANKFTADPTSVDGIVNYESVLLGLKPGGQPLTIIRPTDGVVTSDYPLTLLTSAAASKRPLFTKLTNWLTTPAIQKEIVDQTHRRPGVPGVDTGNIFPTGVLFETPFPNTLDVANTLISTYLDTARAPAQTLFVLDTSGSMDGTRLDELKSALKNLAGADTTTSGGFAQFRNRERVTLIPFSTTPGAATVVNVPDGDKTAAFDQIRTFTDDLQADGNTDIYGSLHKAYSLAIKQAAERPNTFVSVVLMTDGENNSGWSSDQFVKYYKSLGAAGKSIPAFVVLFGDGDKQALTDIATLTGGQVFDARNGDLTAAFQAIRGYQ
ncbi:MAG TPA: VWA domain-containing protein [Galbitalea sp.]|jgi:Ca-activated chloride channel family protein